MAFMWHVIQQSVSNTLDSLCNHIHHWDQQRKYVSDTASSLQADLLYVYHPMNNSV